MWYDNLTSGKTTLTEINMPSPADQTGSADQTPSRRWAVVGLLCLAFIIAFVDRVNLSVALADKAFTTLFRLTDSDRGLLSSAIFWTYAALQIPTGFLVDRFGAKWSLGVGFAMWSVVSAATGLANSFAVLFAMRLLLGIGESVINPAGMRWIRYNMPEHRRGLAIGLFQAAAKLGPALGTPIAYWLLVNHGWRSMFVSLGLGSLIWLIPWFLSVRNDDRQRESVERKASPGLTVSFGAVVRSPAMIGTLIGTFAYQYFNYFCLTWMPSYFAEQHGMKLKDSALFTAASYGGFATVAIVAGWAADRLIARGRDAVRTRKTFIIAGLLLASTELIGAFSGQKNVALFFAIVSLSGLGLATANYWALTQTLIPNGPVGRIVGLQNLAANIPGIVAPILTGWLVHATGGYGAPMAVVAGLLLTGVASYVFLVRAEYAPKAGAP